jgi:aspartyl-tRNA(Asn)/glutamyl-tRNA(Gln) amidotransferase subunit C
VKVTLDTVRELAELAELELDAPALERMRRDLDAILGYVELLSELDTTDVPPTAHVLDVATPMRVDEVKDVLPIAEIVRNVPEHSDSSIVVPKVLD